MTSVSGVRIAKLKKKDSGIYSDWRVSQALLLSDRNSDHGQGHRGKVSSNWMTW